MKVKKLFKKYWWTIFVGIVLIYMLLYFIGFFDNKNEDEYLLISNLTSACIKKDDCRLFKIDNIIYCINKYENLGIPLKSQYTQPQIPYACWCDLDTNKCMLAQ